MDLTLISIVLGLGLTELLLTFYRLVQARRRVTWDALPLAWALLILIAVVNFWWGIRGVLAGASGWTTGDFMLTMISPIFIFLACAAVLPKAELDRPMDMKAAYAEERTAFLLSSSPISAGTGSSTCPGSSRRRRWWCSSIGPWCALRSSSRCSGSRGDGTGAP